MGEALANMEMFLLCTTLLQRFELRMVEANNPDSSHNSTARQTSLDRPWIRKVAARLSPSTGPGCFILDRCH